MSAEPIPSSDYIKAGVLDKWVRQPTDNSPIEQSNGEINMTEKWKGPYSTGKSILSSIKTGDTLASVHAALGSKQDQIPAPACPIRNSLTGVWKVKEIRVEELTPGDHCMLHLKFYADYATNDVQTLVEIEELNVWSVTWQTYQLTPEEFVSGKGGAPIPWSPSNTPPTPQWGPMANFGNIMRYEQNNPEKIGDWYVFTPDVNVPDVRYALNPAEGVALEKIKSKKNATWHYPVLTHQVVKEGRMNSSLTDTIFQDIDTQVDSFHSGCPYTFPTNKWLWVKVGDEVSQSKDRTKQKVTYTLKTTWIGYPKTDDGLDPNYYGTGDFSHTEQGIKNGRWYPGCL